MWFWVIQIAFFSIGLSCTICGGSGNGCGNADGDDVTFAVGIFFFILQALHASRHFGWYCFIHFDDTGPQDESNLVGQKAIVASLLFSVGLVCCVVGGVNHNKRALDVGLVILCGLFVLHLISIFVFPQDECLPLRQEAGQDKCGRVATWTVAAILFTIGLPCVLNDDDVTQAVGAFFLSVLVLHLLWAYAVLDNLACCLTSAQHEAGISTDSLWLAKDPKSNWHLLNNASVPSPWFWVIQIAFFSIGLSCTICGGNGCGNADEDDVTFAVGIFFFILQALHASRHFGWYCFIHFDDTGPQDESNLVGQKAIVASLLFSVGLVCCVVGGVNHNKRALDVGLVILCGLFVLHLISIFVFPQDECLPLRQEAGQDKCGRVATWTVAAILFTIGLPCVLNDDDVTQAVGAFFLSVLVLHLLWAHKVFDNLACCFTSSQINAGVSTTTNGITATAGATRVGTAAFMTHILSHSFIQVGASQPKSNWHSLYNVTSDPSYDDYKYMEEGLPRRSPPKRESRWERLERYGTTELYHQTDKESALQILSSQRMLRGGGGSLGGGIYFAGSAEETNRKAHKTGIVLKANVYLGRTWEDKSGTGGQEYTHTNLLKRGRGYDSVTAKWFRSGTEYVVYNYDQVTDIKLADSKSVHHI